MANCSMDLTQRFKSTWLRISNNDAGCCAQSGLRGERTDKKRPVETFAQKCRRRVAVGCSRAEEAEGIGSGCINYIFQSQNQKNVPVDWMWLMRKVEAPGRHQALVLGEG